MNSPQPLSDALQQLLKGQQVWRASTMKQNMQQDVRAGIPTGYKQLETYLPGKGWPNDGLMEILHDKPGIGELRLFAPALAHLSQQQNRWLLWVSPPYIPYAPALARSGIDLTRVLIVNPASSADTLWVLEKALASQSCSAVMAWPGHSSHKQLSHKQLSHKQLRRLQVACKAGHCLGLLYRPDNASEMPSPAELRIRLFPHPRSQADTSAFNDHSLLELQILKRKGGWKTEKFQLFLKDQLNQFTPDFTGLQVNQPRPQNLQTHTFDSQEARPRHVLQ